MRAVRAARRVPATVEVLRVWLAHVDVVPAGRSHCRTAGLRRVARRQGPGFVSVKGHDWKTVPYSNFGMVCMFDCARCGQRLQAFYQSGGLPDLESELFGWELIEPCEEHQARQVHDS